MCEHMYYRNGDNYFPYLYCRLDDKICPYTKKCMKEERFVANGELWKECYKMIENKNTEEFFVVLEEEGKLQFVADDALINELLPIFQKNILELAAKITKRE